MLCGCPAIQQATSCRASATDFPGTRFAATVIDEQLRFLQKVFSIQQPMKRYILCLLGAIIAMAFIASCQEQGTTTTTASPAPTKGHVKTSSGNLYRNPAPSPTP